MNLFQRLLPRQLCDEAPADGAPGGGGPAGDTPLSREAQPEGAALEKTPSGDDKGNPAQQDNSGKTADEQENKSAGAPEKYEFKAAEGTDLDTSALADFEPVARELNLTQEQAQKLVDVYPKILAGVQHRQVEIWQRQTEDWAAEVKADKDIGGDKLVSNLSVAQRALEQFGSAELKEYLNGTGLGNHPELVKFCVKVGKAMGEDNMVVSGNGGQLSAAEILYGKK